MTPLLSAESLAAYERWNQQPAAKVSPLPTTEQPTECKQQ
jgi:hypothetical protein